MENSYWQLNNVIAAENNECILASVILNATPAGVRNQTHDFVSWTANYLPMEHIPLLETPAQYLGLGHKTSINNWRITAVDYEESDRWELIIEELRE